MKQIQTAHTVDEWAELLSQYFVPLEANTQAQDDPVSSSSPQTFFESIMGHRWGSLTMAHLNVASHTVTRNRAHIEEGNPGYLKMAVQCDGNAIIAQDGKEAVLQAGEFALFDSSKPYTVLFDNDSTSQIILFPRHLLALPHQSVQQLSVLPFQQDNPLTQAVSSFAKQCSNALFQLQEPVSRRLANNLVDLLGTVLAQEYYADERSTVPVEKQRRRELITKYIEDNIDNSRLDPQSIATAHFMSVRTLHQLFEDTGDTVASIVRSVRLERCRLTLEDPSLDTTPIAAIAARWGFADSAHFSRAFRQAYGTPPSRWRASR